MFKRLLKMTRAWWKNLTLTVVALIISALLNMIPSELIRAMTEKLSTPDALTQEAVLYFFLILTVSYVIRAVFRFLSMWQSHIAAWRFVADTTLQCFRKLEELPMRYFSSRSTGEIMSRTINDSRELETLIAHSLPDLFSGIVIILFVTVRIFLINPVLASITLIPVPATVLLSTQFSKRVKPLFNKNRAFLGELTGHLQDRVSGIREIKAFGKEEKEYRTMREFAKEYSAINIRANFANGIYQPSVECVISMGTAIVLGLGGTLALKDTLSAADIVGFFVYLSMFYTPLSTLGRIVEDIATARASANRVFELLDTELEIMDSENAVPLDNAVGNVTFRDVRFSYRKGEPVLDGVSFEATRGKTVAIVGGTGAGKTTIISLLERFYDVDDGAVLLDGHNVKDITLASLRNNLSVVLQDVFLFNGTVYENIAYGAENATPEQVYEAAKMARCDRFITAMPEGYQTKIGERGTRLSGGQKQRIAIARAILRNKPVLILDEATSAVDNETEAEIQQAIESLNGKSTVIVIAHRLSTVMKADTILVLQNGKIQEQGTHTELIEKGGIYAKMCSVNDMKLS